jgi:hypothetical protein
MEGNEIAVNSKGILNTSTVGKEIGTHNNQEGVLQGFKSNMIKGIKLIIKNITRRGIINLFQRLICHHYTETTLGVGSEI